MAIRKLTYPMVDTIAADENDINKPNFTYVMFVPRIWDSSDGIAASLTGLGDSNNAVEAVKSLWNGVKSVFGDVKGLSTNKQAFIQSLKYVKFENASLVIALPFDPKFVSNISHATGWVMENSANMDEIKHAVGMVDQAIQGKVGGVVKEGVATLASKGKNMILDALKDGPLKLGNFGLAIYQPKRQMFSGVEPMGFDFEWELIPRNPDEADEILNIVNAFRILAYPTSFASGTITKQAARQPALWEIQFPNGGKFEDLIVKGNRVFCVINSVNITLGQTSDSSKLFFRFADGTPNIIKLSIKFSEYFNPMDATERFGDRNTSKFTATKSNTTTETPTERPK